LKRLGGNGLASTLMFAKFSPDGGRVGWVRYGEHNIYVEDIASGKLTQLTHDGSRTTINGTFDWVYEEELGLQDGWRRAASMRSTSHRDSNASRPAARALLRRPRARAAGRLALESRWEVDRILAARRQPSCSPSSSS